MNKLKKLLINYKEWDENKIDIFFKKEINKLMITYKTWLWIQDSLDLFINHYRYWGEEYTNSTILVDSSFNIMAYFDRWTKSIFCVQCDLDFNYNIIVGNDKKIITKQDYIYIPIDYAKAVKPFKTELIWLQKNEKKNKKKIEEILKKINKQVSDYNTKYFENLENRINKQELLCDDSSDTWNETDWEIR